MNRTTLYLPDELKRAVERAAARKGVSEAEVVRQAIRDSVAVTRRRPRGALFHGGQPIARNVDEALAGFGDR